MTSAYTKCKNTHGFIISEHIYRVDLPAEGQQLIKSSIPGQQLIKSSIPGQQLIKSSIPGSEMFAFYFW